MPIEPATPTAAPQNRPITSFRGGYAFLSSFANLPDPISYKGLVGPTIEHVFQAAKTNDPEEQRHVLASVSPMEARRRGRRITLRPGWDSAKLAVMASLVQLKFSQPAFASLLVKTGDAPLYEGNHWCDTFWGVCTCRKHATVDNIDSNANDPATAGGTGENWLGRILTINRSFLQG